MEVVHDNDVDTDAKGSDAGLSASTVQRLTETWGAEHAQWSTRDLSEVDYV